VNRTPDASGPGWATLDTAGMQRAPGVHDIGARLGMIAGTLLLIVLRAAESWSPELNAQPGHTSVVRRGGAMLVEFQDRSTALLDAEHWLCDTGSVADITNIGTDLAGALVITMNMAG
jgi:hypothetical protein